MQNPDELRAGWAQQEDKSEDLPIITQLAIDVVGARGKRYQGTFTFKVPTIGEQIEIGRLKAAYLPQGAVADPNAALLVEQCCFLAVTIQKPTPAWFKPFELYDAAPISALYREASQYERRFLGADQKPSATPTGSESTEDADGSDPLGELSLGEDVQPASKRRKVVIAESA